MANASIKRMDSPARVAALIAEQLPTGIFLCVPGSPANVMTIGWGGLTHFWRRDVFIAPVRPQRHTYGLLEKAGVFTLSVPMPGQMGKALAQAGTLCGRDGDKFAAIGLGTRPGRVVAAPVVEGCALYIECRVMARNAFTTEGTDPAITEADYAQGDFHTLFYGEIVSAYWGNDA